MHWLPLAILTALAVATQDAWVKRFFSHLSPYHMVSVPLFYSLPLFYCSVILIPMPDIGPEFGSSFLLSIPINGISLILYMTAIKHSPLSLTIPYLAFTPAFMIVTGRIFLDETPGPAGIIGILVVSAGGYILNINPREWRLLSPILAVFRETGSWIMLIVSFLYGFGAVLGKKGIQHSSPLFFNLWFFAVFNILLLVLFRISGKIRFRPLLESPVNGFTAGLFFFLHAVFHCLAIVRVQAAYMIAVKRLSILISVLYGKLIFREKNMVFRISGALLMLTGTIILTLSSL